MTALGCAAWITSERLSLVGGREGAVRAGLGELISYIEFELKNHPRIDEAERFVDAVEGLRSKIES